MQTSRRTLATGAAWSLPVIVLATPAPAFAASKCVNYTMDYNNLGTASGFTLGGVTVGTTVTSTANTGTVFSANGTIGFSVRQTTGSTATSNLGNATAKNLLFNLDGNATTTLTMTFSKQVYNLKLTFRDVTNNPTNLSQDSLAFTPAAASYTNLTNSGVGITSPPSPLQRSGTGFNNNGTTYYDAAANFPGPLTSVTVTVSNAYTPNPGTIAVGLYQVAFCA